MSWTVLSVAYPLAPVSENSVGGAEQVLATLDRALVQAGHRSIVIAAHGSRVRGDLVALPSIPESITEAVRADSQRATREALASVLVSQTIDLVHLHGVDYSAYLPQPGTPTLVTLHLPLAWYPPEAFRVLRPKTYLHCVSFSQSTTEVGDAVFLRPIPNGVDLDRFQLRTRKQNYALMLGRICPEKGVHIALRACRAAGIPLLIGGQVYPYPAHQDYFAAEVQPLLDRCRRFLGPLALARKTALLAAAKCVLIPSLAAETSSLVAMEALASGTPVIAFRSGALPDIVKDGYTGFVVENEQQMTHALSRIHEIAPESCRNEGCQRFGDGRTIRAYFDTYSRILALP